MPLPRPMRLSRPAGLAVALLAAGALLVGCFPRGPGPRLAHFAIEAPAVGDLLPDVGVVDEDGEPIRLRDLLQGKPLVLQLGSASCPVFRYRRFGMEALVRELGDRVEFAILYTREAHPVGSPSPYTDAEWDPWINRLAGARWPDTQTTSARLRQATQADRNLDLVPRILVDPSENPAWTGLGRAPSAAFVVDAGGRIVHRQVWVDPPEIRRVLRTLLPEG